MTNLLRALKNLVDNPLIDISDYYRGRIQNRANSAGSHLEAYVKDVFCGTIKLDSNCEQRNTIYNKELSYLGNQNNPPDMIIKGGDAVEIKKIGNFSSQIALNSSYPKDKLYADDPMLSKACKECENWEEKDIIYVIGVVKNNRLRVLWFVYGDCYAANKNTYCKIKNKISEGVNSLQGVDFAKTRELGRINGIDPLGITYMRVRGMWGIDSPSKVFSYLTGNSSESKIKFKANAIMLAEKYNTFPKFDREAIENTSGNNFLIKDVNIKSPNNPANLLSAKLIEFFV